MRVGSSLQHEFLSYNDKIVLAVTDSNIWFEKITKSVNGASRQKTDD